MPDVFMSFMSQHLGIIDCVDCAIVKLHICITQHKGPPFRNLNILMYSSQFLSPFEIV